MLLSRWSINCFLLQKKSINCFTFHNLLLVLSWLILIVFDYIVYIIIILLFARSKPLHLRSTLYDQTPVLFILGIHVSSEVLLFTIADSFICLVLWFRSRFFLLWIFFCLNHPVLNERALGNPEFGREISKVWLTVDCSSQSLNSGTPDRLTFTEAH
jgi:hypothetical protein